MHKPKANCVTWLLCSEGLTKAQLEILCKIREQQIYPMKTEERTQRIMNTANQKPVSDILRLSVEKTSKCKAFAVMKLSSGNLIDPLYL